MITILTPTYNRAYTLPDLYETLLLQEGDFEWLVIDDGSTDTTSAWFASIAPLAPFPLRLISQPNGGKHRAINTGVNAAHGEVIFIVDSDDRLTPDAIQTIEHALPTLPPTYGGLCYRRAYHDGNLIGNHLTDPHPLTLTPTQAGHLFGGDLAYIFRTDVMKKSPFPTISHETFVPELLIWNQIADHTKILFIPDKAIYLTEYLPDGYSRNFKKNLQRNPEGFGLFYRDQITRERSVLAKIKCAIRFLQCRWYAMNKGAR